DAAHQLLARDLTKWRMGDEDGDDVGLAYGFQRLAKRDVGERDQLLGETGQIRIGYQDAILTGARQLRCNRDRRALPRVVDIRLVGQTQTGDDRSLEPLGSLPYLRDDKLWLGVIDLTRCADQPRSLRRRRNDEPWI